MGFGKFIGGILLGVLAVALAIFGFAVLLGLFSFIETSWAIPLGIVLLIVALFVFAYGWYSYKSAKPKGTMNVDHE